MRLLAGGQGGDGGGFGRHPSIIPIGPVQTTSSLLAVPQARDRDWQGQLDLY